MNVKQHIRMTASEIAMGRYMRAPEHPPVEDEFSKAFDAELLTGAAEGGGNGTDGTAPAPAAGADGAGDAGGAGTAADAGAAAEQGADGTQAAAPEEAGEAATDGAAAGNEGGEQSTDGAGDAGGDGAGGDAGDGAAAADGGAPDKAGAKTPAVSDSGENADAILDRLAEAVAKKAPPKAEAPPAEQAATDSEQPLFNETETAALAKFKEDWPAEHEAITLMQRELGAGLVKYIFDQIAPSVREIKELTNTLAARQQLSDIADGLTEYPSDDEIDKIKEWVKTQPTYLQAGMNGVIDGGTADEVIDLVGRYREATGQKQPAGEQAPAPKPQGETELSGAAKQAAEALAPVGSKRSAVQSPDDTSNFDAAWDKFKVDESV